MKEIQPCVYILTNKPNGVLYIGMTTNIIRRLEQYLSSKEDSFVSKYKLYNLIHLELFNTIDEAASREKQLKHWKRDWKIELIEKSNPKWKDLKALLS